VTGNVLSSETRCLITANEVLVLQQGVETLSSDFVSALLRKEVIQAHLPVLLPCYDFVPVTSPTLDSALPCGLGYRLQVLPAPMT